MKPVTVNITGYRLTGNRLTTLPITNPKPIPKPNPSPNPDATSADPLFTIARMSTVGQELWHTVFITVGITAKTFSFKLGNRPVSSPSSKYSADSSDTLGNSTMCGAKDARNTERGSRMSVANSQYFPHRNPNPIANPSHTPNTRSLFQTSGWGTFATVSSLL